MPSMGMFNEDTPHLDYIEFLWSKLDKIKVDFSTTSGPHPSSDFGRDQAALREFSGYVSALELIACSLDHLRGLRQLVGNEPKGFKHWRLQTPWTLLRAAHEMASQSIWLSSPNDQRVRIERLLQFMWDDAYQDANTQLQVLNPRKRKARLDLSQAEQVFDKIALPWYKDGKTQNRIKTPISFSDCVYSAAETSGIVQPRTAVGFWRTASAYAHGRSWANRYVAILIDLGDGTQGWKPDYRVMAVYITMVLNTVVYALHSAHIRCGNDSHRYRPVGQLRFEPPKG